MSLESKTVKKLTSDVFISGGGPVGLMLAIGFAKLNKTVVLAEPYPVDDSEQTAASKNSFDGRVLALSKGSQRFLKSIEIWDSLKPYCTAIEHIHISQKGYLGLTTLHANEVDVDALGFSVQSKDLGKVLWQAVKQLENITVLTPAKLNDFKQQDDRVVVNVVSTEKEHDLQTESSIESSIDSSSRLPEEHNLLAEISTQLIIGADGTNSRVREILELPIEEHFYDAFGVLAQIETEQDPQGWAYERFTDEGPVALLPMNGNFHKAVLVCPQDQIEVIQSLSDKDYISLFADKMGERLGRFVSVSDRIVYPLKETYAPKMVSGRAVLMGNASHTQHPVAAQGLNLGIRDIQEFLQMCQSYDDLGDTSLLQAYAQQREPDHKKVMGLTDSLIQIFQHKSPVVGHLRGLGLMAMQAMPGLKKRFSKFAMNGQRQNAQR